MSTEKPDDARMTRRGFLAGVGRASSFVALGGIGVALAAREGAGQMVWQIDPFTCTQCGQCQTECVLQPSAVKCVHDMSLCGYCDFCFGYFITGTRDWDEAAEHQRCPTGAIARRLVESPYYEYTVDHGLCVGCARCVQGCQGDGNGSLYLQVVHPGPNPDAQIQLRDGRVLAGRCLNCSECSIAAACPADAFVRVPARTPYFIKSLGRDQLGGAYRLGC